MSKTLKKDLELIAGRLNLKDDIIFKYSTKWDHVSIDDPIKYHPDLWVDLENQTIYYTKEWARVKNYGEKLKE